MQKPTKAECIAWAQDCEAKVEEYERIAAEFRESGHDASADLWQMFAASRRREASDLRLFLRTL